jgi:hypothetical protein
MSFANTIYNLRSANATMVQVADAVDGLASGRKSNLGVTATGSETIATENVIFVNNSSDITRTMPSANTAQGKTYIYVKVSDNTNTCTIAAASGSIFGEHSNVLSARGHYIAYVCDGANYFQISGNVLNWVSWTPTFNTVGGMVVTVNTNHACRYAKLGTEVYFDIDLSVTTSGTASGWLELNNIPAGAGLSANARPLVGIFRQPASGGDAWLSSCFCAGTTLNVRRVEGGDYTLDTLRLRISGVRRV